MFADDLPSISHVQFAEYARSEVVKGDIVVAIGGYIGPIGLISSCSNFHLNINRHLARVSPDTAQIDPYYLAAFLASNTSQTLLIREVRGAVQAGINIADLKLHPVLIAEGVGQESVSKLMRAAEASIVSSKTAYYDAQLILESGLHPECQKAISLSNYTSRYSVIGLHEAVNANRLDAQCFAPQAVALHKALATHGKCVPLASLLKSSVKGRQQDEVESGAINYCSIKHISSHEVVAASCANPPPGIPVAEEKDLLLAITGATIGKVGIVRRFRQLAFSGDLLRLRSRSEVDPHFLLAALDHRLGQIQFNSWITGSTNGHLAPRDVGRILVPRLEPKCEMQIAELIEDSLAKRQESETLLERAKRRVEELIEEAVNS
jgi:hypothetical protein